MPPSAIIDTDLDPFDNTIMYVAELDALWKATTLGGGNAVWTQVYDVANFDAALGSALVIDRIRCAKITQNLVYSIGHGLGTDGSTYYEFCGVSSNGGTTWNWYQIGEIEPPGEGFTLTGTHESDVSGCTTTISMEGTGRLRTNFVHDGTNEFPNTTLHAVCDYDESLIPANQLVTIEYDATGQWLSDDYDTAADQPPEFLSAGHTPATGSYTGTHFSGTIHTANHATGIFHFGYAFGYPGRWVGSTAVNRTFYLENLTINGVSFGGEVSRAFDVSPTNSSWLYFGATDKIWASEDGGVTWFAFYTSHGAYDICIDPQLAGAIYYWSTDGNLNLLMKQTLGAAGVLTSTGLMTETTTNTPLRIARDPSSGRLLAIASGTTLKMRLNGTNSDLKTGLVAGTGLHAYPGQMIIFVDNANIWISNNIQAVSPTITAKKGGWAAFSGGVNAHRMTA